MEKETSITVSTQIRLGESLYDYVNAESKRLAISMNAVMNTLIDEARRYREAKIVIQPTE